MLKLMANIESFDNHYVAYIENAKNIKGMVVEGSSIEEVINELLISLKVKIAYDYGIDVNSINTKQFKSKKDLLEFKRLLKDGKAKKELSLSIC